MDPVVHMAMFVATKLIHDAYIISVTAVSRDDIMAEYAIQTIADTLSVSPVNMMVATIGVFSAVTIAFYASYRARINRLVMERSLKKIERNKYQKF